MRLLHACMLLFLCASASNAYKILVYNPQFGHSHSNFMGMIADVLAEAGHNVTSLIPIFDEKIKPGTTKTTIINVPAGEEMLVIRKGMNREGGENPFFSSSFLDWKIAFIFSHFMGKMFTAQCRTTLLHPGLIERLANENYDVFIVENFEMCGMGMSHLLKPKATVAMTAGALYGIEYDEFGVPLLPSFNPSPYTTHIDPHSMWNRLWNLIGEFMFRRFFAPGRSYTQSLFWELYGSDYPTFEELTSRTAYIFTNADPLIDYAHPTLHKIIDIGGIGFKAPAPLNEDWQSVLFLRERTVLVSFGSVAPSWQMPEAYKHGILKAVTNFPDITFIWKYEKPEDEFSTKHASKVKNLVLSKWTPQADLLNHPKLIAFMSHGGMGSVQETASRGVPGLFIPLFGDQPRNAGAMERNRLGKMFDKFDLGNSEKLTAALKEIIENPLYRSNAQKMKVMLQKKPFKSRDLLIKYIEFAAEFGPSPSLRPQSYDMNIVEYYNLDIILISLALLVAIAYVTLKIALSICFGIRGKQTKQKTS